MDFNHYTDQTVALAVNLVNTFGWVSGNEHLNTHEDLTRFLSEQTGPWTEDLPPSVDSDIAAVHELRGRLRQVFESPDPAAAASELNQILADSSATPRISVHGGAPHLHFEPADGSLPSWLGVVTAMGLATVLADHGMERLGICQSEACADAYVDTSRNRSRRHCSTTCGTREHVAAHRERKRQEG